MTSDPRQAGFSLTELLVAMLVTLLVSGAVFGLLTAGQGAFRREPELTDRQQNIRVAMDLIQRDISNAGVGLGPWAQAFTTGLDGQSGIPPGSLNGPSGGPVDALEILGSDGECPDVPVTPPVTGGVANTAVAIPQCYPPEGLIALTQPGAPPTMFWAIAHGVTAYATSVTFPSPQPPGIVVPDPFQATSLSRAQLVRYEVANDVDGVPSLFRSSTGGLDPVTAVRVNPGPGLAAQAAGWQLVARGIEDLQVTYVQAGNPPPAATPNPLPVTAPNYNTLVQAVRVQLWARAMAQNLQGMRIDGGMPPAVRGSLWTSTSPRPSLLWLRGAPPPYTWQ